MTTVADGTDQDEGVRCRKRQRTLDDFFSMQTAAQPSSFDSQRSSRLWNLPPEVLQTRIFQCLTVQDMTRLSMTCRYGASVVESRRGPKPYIFREEVLPEKMMYLGEWEAPETDFDYEDRSDEVHRTQSLRFLLRTRCNGVVQVEVRLGTGIWVEFSDRLDSDWGMFEYDDDEASTWVDCRVFQQVKLRNGFIKRTKIFETAFETLYNDEEIKTYWMHDYDEPMYSDSDDFLITEEEKESYDTEHMTLSDEAKFRSCIHYVYICTKRIAASPETYNFPSLDYMIKSAIPRRLYHFLPPEFVPDPSKIVNRKFFHRWLYRHPPSREVWEKFFQETCETHLRYDSDTGTCDNYQREFEIHEIPWYRDWYPKPVVLDRRNLISSLPLSITAKSILPFLSSSDFVSLTGSCPAVASGMMNIAQSHFSAPKPT